MVHNVRVAVAQIPIEIANVSTNLATHERIVRLLAEDKVELVLFPECSITGYLYDSEDEVRAHAIRADGPEISTLQDLSTELSMVITVGFVEVQPDGTLYNTAATIDGDTVTLYRKAHLPFIGADRFVSVGDNMPVVANTRAGRIGMNICYDLRYPEWARSLSLNGAQIMLHPTNWAIPAEPVARILPPARAMENAMYVLVANRGDIERGVDWVGMSGIYEPTGATREQSGRGEAVIVADIDLDLAQRSEIVVEPGVFELDLFGSRRPELYGKITDSNEA